MKINQVSNPIVSSEAKASPKLERAAVDTDISRTASGDEVILSGHALMLSRLFDGKEPSSIATSTRGGLIAAHLTEQDRSLVEKMYEYSVKNGIDLRHVDALATDIGAYRLSPDTVRGVDLYDGNGRKLNIEFSAADKASSERISKAASDSDFDQGFLQSRLIPGGRFANFNFLERMVQVFSSSPSDESGPLAEYDPELNKNVVTATEKDNAIEPSNFLHNESSNLWSLQRGSQENSSVGAKIVDALNANSGLDNGFKSLLIGFSYDQGVGAGSLLELFSLAAEVRKHG